MATNWDDESEISEINMTPLVDVMLVLLIIFMVTLPVLTHTVSVDLPKISAAAPDSTRNPILLTIKKNGIFMWGSDAVNRQELERRLLSSNAEYLQAGLALAVDREVPYEQVLEVLTVAQGAGWKKVSFMTMPKPQ